MLHYRIHRTQPQVNDIIELFEIKDLRCVINSKQNINSLIYKEISTINFFHTSSTIRPLLETRSASTKYVSLRLFKETKSDLMARFTEQTQQVLSYFLIY